MVLTKIIPKWYNQNIPKWDKTDFEENINGKNYTHQGNNDSIACPAAINICILRSNT